MAGVKVLVAPAPKSATKIWKSRATVTADSCHLQHQRFDLDFVYHFFIMENDQGKVVDLYVPRKCAATNRLITAKDHASVQINIGHVDENGQIIPGQQTTYALCGFVRTRSESDDSLNRLATQDNLLEGVWSAQR